MSKLKPVETACLHCAILMLISDWNIKFDKSADHGVQSLFCVLRDIRKVCPAEYKCVFDATLVFYLKEILSDAATNAAH